MGIVGLILGIAASVKINRSNGKLGGRAMALAGTIVSAVSLLMLFVTALLVSILLPSLSHARNMARETVVKSQIRELAVAVQMYASENKGRYPPAETFPDALQGEMAGAHEIDRNRKVPGRPEYAVVMNRSLSGLRLAELSETPSDTVLFFLAEVSTGNAGDRADLLPEPVFYSGYIIGFADGSVRSVLADELDEICWKP